jgi:spermidine synthase
MSLVINGKPDSSSSLGDMKTMMLPAHITMNLRKNPQDCLLIGLGAGFTLGSILKYPVRSVTCAEIEPAVYRAAALFVPIIGRTMEDQRVTMVFDDGRHFLARQTGLFDAIICEPSNQYVAGMANLYTREFYALALSRLRPGGTFSQWMHYYGADIGDCLTAVRTFGAVFPEVALWYHPDGDFFLVGSKEPLPLDMGRLRATFRDRRISDDLARVGIRNPLEMAAHMLMDGTDVMRFAGPGTLCTDDLPSLEFTTPMMMNDPASASRNLAGFMAYHPRNPLRLAGETSRDRLSLGMAHEATGSLGRALAEYRRAARLSPGAGDCWWRLARVLNWLGKTDRARGATRNGLLVDPGSPILRGLRSELGEGAKADPLAEEPDDADAKADSRGASPAPDIR